MSNEDFIFEVNTLVGCKYSILKELQATFHIEKKYRKKFRRSKYVSLLTTFLSYFDRWRYQLMSGDLEITKQPIYILGHWRSGTTLLHNLLCCHKNIAFPTTYQTVFPNNLFFFRGVIKGIMQYYLPEKRLVDHIKMHVDFPQEEDFALGNEEGFSFYYWFFFPNEYQKVTDEFLTLSTENAQKMQKYKLGYRRFIKRCLLNVRGDQYIAKNPPNMARIPFLLNLFPGSRFVYIERNPYEVLMSTFRFHKGFLKTLQLQDMDDETLWNFITQTYGLMYQRFQEDKHMIPENHLVEIKYEELVADPERIYNSLHRRLFSDLKTNESKLNSVLQANRTHSANTYHFERAYIDRINARLAGVIEKQGYQLL
jgi:hypothetical protein